MQNLSARWVKVARGDALPGGKGLIVSVENVTLALFRVQGQCYAIDNRCPHRGGPLGEGELEGHVVTCPWHGWTWDVRTGANVRNPALRSVACYRVTEAEGDVLVALP